MPPRPTPDTHATCPSARRSSLAGLLAARRLLAGAALCAPLCLAGCWTEGGRGYSNDSYTYISRTWEPKTISVIDTRTGQSVWTYEIPVGRQLNIEFFQGGSGDAMNPDQLKWSDREAGTIFSMLDNTVAVPAADARRVDWKLRPTPEYAPGLAGSNPASAPAGGNAAPAGTTPASATTPAPGSPTTPAPSGTAPAMPPGPATGTQTPPAPKP